MSVFFFLIFAKSFQNWKNENTDNDEVAFLVGCIIIKQMFVQPEFATAFFPLRTLV